MIGLTNHAGDLNASIQLPSWAPRGLPLTVQAVAAPGTGRTLTAASPAVVHVL